MGRWEPDARGRMIRVAVELFAERGFEQTTAGDIAERAGVTERTFFRHFADKREVLFDGSNTMARTAHDAILGAPDELSPLDAALAGMVAGGSLLADRRDHAARRSQIIAANPSLRERELLKLAAMVDATAEALRARGIAEPTASLAAHSAVTVFQIACGRWVRADEPADLAAHIAQTAAVLRALA
ncbi:TetR family transcriptional regulator [Frankia sp. CNm7]|uniref:TetR family transcriptional regulator n=1 Tax=Frankia nepalensis TaxID=1836974 RepID=A0A937RMV8_9ACTN|nr:TetR family transcriptional regulator [Frankia nepalensis]MBL7515397.1 TetR family transcriptional regulator [Frankia nepalensis]MBL7523086.1 TetR family transcriptional regulator [Frankia nepalensis]MBL7629333.1 TetR family transcriptional regulator [Frankia nepalensis]